METRVHAHKLHQRKGDGSDPSFTSVSGLEGFSRLGNLGEGWTKLVPGQVRTVWLQQLEGIK